MDVQRELGTYYGDLPHAFEAAGNGQFCKHCSHVAHADIHSKRARETAAVQSSTLPRELGS